MKVKFVGMLWVVFLGTSLSIKLLGTYYSDIVQNLPALGFSYSVVSKWALNTALHNDKVQVIYAYVRMGHLTGKNGSKIPLVCSQSVGNLDLEEFLKTLVQYNDESPRPKAAFLHFAYEYVLENSVDILKKFYEPLKFLVFINGCVLMGPGNSTKELHNPYKFFELASKFPEFILGVEWTTAFTFKAGLAYTARHIAEMVVLLRHHHVSETPVAIRIRSSGILGILPYLRYMIDNIPNSTIIIYENVVDKAFSKEEFEEIVTKLGKNEVIIQGKDRFYNKKPS